MSQSKQTFSLLSRFWLKSCPKVTPIIHVSWNFFSPFCCSWLYKLPNYSQKEQEAGVTQISTLTITGTVQGVGAIRLTRPPSHPLPRHHEQQLFLYKLLGTLCVRWFLPWDMLHIHNKKCEFRLFLKRLALE